MNCKCGSVSLVVDSRSDRDTNQYKIEPGTVRRRRKCPRCGATWITVEMRQEDLEARADREAANLRGKLAALGPDLLALAERIIAIKK